MHCRDLVELAGLLAVRSRFLPRGGISIAQEAVEDYWIASKCRLDRWGRSLKIHSMRICAAPSNATAPLWRAVRPTLEEILTGEVLTRVFTALCCHVRRERAPDAAAPLARNILAGHLESRRRALNLLVFGHGLDVDEAIALNRLRRRNESWSDLLLAMLDGGMEAEEFAFCPERYRDFAIQSRADRATPVRESLVMASLRMSYQHDLSETSPNTDLNSQIATGVLGCFDRLQFDSTGALKSLWLERLTQAANDTQCMIDELLSNDPVKDDSIEDDIARRGRRFRGRDNLPF